MTQTKSLILLVLLILSYVPSVGQKQGIAIVPRPNQYKVLEGQFKLSDVITVASKSEEFKGLVAGLSQQAQKQAGIKLLAKKRKAQIRLIQSEQTGSEESYVLKITPDLIEIETATEEGVFYGMQSLIQMMIQAKQEGTVSIPCCIIKDSPRYPWRGLMLDESRHFFGKAEVKKILDMMALHKLNKFHWHLTDESAWRIEIKKYPLLTEVGGAGTRWNSDAPVKFYTQADIKDVIAYAAERYIEVIPEVDMPGHASAAVRAYPEVGGGGSDKWPNFTFHPGKEMAYQFLTDILREVAGLFPSPYIHIGGDEVHYGNQQWSSFPEVQELMKNEGLKDLVDVEHYFLNRMADSVKVIGKRVLGWDEVTNAGLSSERTGVMWWRHDKPEMLKSSIDNGFETILCPRRPLYFDFVQHESHTDGRRWSGFCPIEDVYAFPNAQITGGEFYKSDLVKGIQANVWTETMHTPERLEFMLFPRLSALAEAAWTVDASKDYDDFKARLGWVIRFYEKEGISLFDPLNPERISEIKGVSENK